jgi:hypothetical protein
MMPIIKENSDKGRVDIIRDWYTLINGYQLAPSLFNQFLTSVAQKIIFCKYKIVFSNYRRTLVWLWKLH